MKFINGTRGTPQDCQAEVLRGQVSFYCYNAQGGKKTLATVRPENMIDFACQILGAFSPLELATHDGLSKLRRIVERA